MGSWIDNAKASGRITPLSEACGRNLARLVESTIARLVAEGEPDDRCKSCAFREGTAPNRCADTVMDATKSTIEGTPFLCHVKKGMPCHGWYAARVATRGLPDVKAPWPFSHEEADSAPGAGESAA